MAAGASSIQTRIQGRIKLYCKTSVSDGSLGNSGPLGQEAVQCGILAHWAKSWSDGSWGKMALLAPGASCCTNKGNEVSTPSPTSTQPDSIIPDALLIS